MVSQLGWVSWYRSVLFELNNKEDEAYVAIHIIKSNLQLQNEVIESTCTRTVEIP
jgi:hypothetical protein